RLRNSVNAVVARHEALRTSFHKSEAGNPFQQIHPVADLEIPLRDVSHEESTTLTIIEAAQRKPFDLRTPPLQCQLLKLSPNEHALLLLTHHITCDRWSVTIFMRELTQLYLNHPDKEQGLSALPIQYADWAVWQRERLQGDLLKERLETWRQRLVPPAEELELPYSSEARLTNAGRQFPISINSDLTGKIKSFCGEQQVSLFTAMLSVFKALLYRYTNSPDIVVGSEVANRDQPESVGLIGLLVNTLVLRTRLEYDISVRELVARVHETVVHGLANQDLPFERLVEELNPERDLDQLTPLFQAKFDLQQFAVNESSLDNLRVERIPVADLQAKYALRFNLQDRGDSIFGQIEYAADKFAEETIQRMASHFNNLLNEFVNSPNTIISQLKMLSANEEQEIFRAGQGKSYSIGSETLHGMFESQAEQTPDATAIVDGENSVSYADLNQRADTVAKRLAANGVNRNTLIAIRMRKSADMLAAMLGILKTGCGYVPLDPDYPQQRIDFMLDDSNCVAVVEDDRANGYAIRLLSDKMLNQKETGSTDECDTTRLAYVIYTSGSTGQPKGVAIEHRAAVAMVTWAKREFSEGELAGVLASTSICFDLSIFELFVPLLAGGTVIVCDNLL
ncbi:MAG: condensation domain-containing protein, partial [Planctomycetota bacterium]